jgi:hypothetical protein
MARTATPKISVIERRLQGPSIFRTSSQPIPLVDDGKWVLRWENSKISPDHMWNVIHNLGWTYAEPADLACNVDEIGASERDGRIVRGERGDEVLMKMLAKDYKRVEKKKSDETIKQTFGARQLKQAIVSGVAAEHGEQAAEFMSKNVNMVSVSDSRGPEE